MCDWKLTIRMSNSYWLKFSLKIVILILLRCSQESNQRGDKLLPLDAVLPSPLSMRSMILRSLYSVLST